MKIIAIFEKYIKLRKKLDQGKIYKIVDNTNSNIYIGKTCLTLKKRLQFHEGHYNRFLKGLYGNVKSFNILKNNDYKIELLENCKIKTEQELKARERHYIECNDCVNKNIPGRTSKEWYEANKDKNKEQIKERKKVYYENNKDKIKDKTKIYYELNKNKIKAYKDLNKIKLNENFECLCGGKYTRMNKSSHEKSHKHQKYLNSLI